MRRSWIIVLVMVTLVLTGAGVGHWRWDMTDDGRYSPNAATERLLEQAGDIRIESHMSGEMNSSMQRLADALENLCEDFGIDYATTDSHDLLQREGAQPVAMHDREQNGRSVQYTWWPYAVIRRGNQHTTIPLLHNQRGLSLEENINRSIENLEFSLARTIYYLVHPSSSEVRIVRGEDITTEEQRFELDQFIMDGGRVLWLVDGAQIDVRQLMQEGVSPVLTAYDKLREMIYHYGIRIEAGWIEDRQCDQFPYFFAPSLLTSEQSLMTHNLGQVSTFMVSPLSIVGSPKDSICYEILLASSTATRIRRAPGELRVEDLRNADESTFRYAHIPAAISMEGSFNSAFRHLGTKRNRSLPTRMIVIGTSSILQPAAQGMNNEEFIENALFWLSDDEGLLELRNKVVQLRLLNDARAHQYREKIQRVAIIVPLAILAMVAVAAWLIRRMRYIRPTKRERRLAEE